MNNDELYTEIYKNSRVLNDPWEIQRVKDEIYQTYLPEDGWTIGEITITVNEEDTRFCTIEVELTKQRSSTRNH